MQIVSQMFVDTSAAHDKAMKWQREGYKNIRITPTTEQRLVSAKVTEQRVFYLTAYKPKGTT